MIEQDPSSLIYCYKQSSEEEIDACTQLSQLPTTITGLQAFMNGFCPSTEPSTLIYCYKQSSEEEIDACTQLSQLPTMIMGLQAFMNGFRPSTEGGDI
jgi:hypothetical protein